MMVKLVVKAQFTVEGTQHAAFLFHLRQLAESSRAEAGCISFACLQDLDQSDGDKPESFVVLEEWDDQASFERHEASAHVARFKADAGSMIIARQPTRVYIVSTAGTLDDFRSR